MIQTIKNFIKRTPLYKPICSVLGIIDRKKEMIEWEKRGRSGPPPPVIKQRVVGQYAQQFNVDTLVETGTYMGEMIRATKDIFREIFSIELGDELYKEAKKKFAKYPYISIIHGDSAKVLPKILKSLKRPCLFWLDAHYSGGITVKGNIETPIAEELRAILSHPVRNHIILIDDARCFNGKNDYPTVEWLKDYILKCRPNWNFEIKNDIIRIHPTK